MDGRAKPYFAVIVGAGLSGATVANRIATVLGKRVLVLDKRDHIAGNIHDYIDHITGTRVSSFGAHLFHTNDEAVMRFMESFGTWRRWDHKVQALVGGRLVPMPPNINTINALFNLNLATPAEAEEWLSKERVGMDADAMNAEEMCLARVGPRLYELLFKEYTRKQWGCSASELGPSVTARIPVRFSWDDRYFVDKFQCLPVNGYTSIVANMLKHPLIDVTTGVHFTPENRARYEEMCEHLVMTGPIDALFSKSGLPPLRYRSIKFHKEYVPVRWCHTTALPSAAVNYPGAETPFTRTIEYKHFESVMAPEVHDVCSGVSLCISETTCDDGEPYYPIPCKETAELYSKYQTLAREREELETPGAPKTLYVGRLAGYKYLDMWAAIRASLDAFSLHFGVPSGFESTQKPIII